MDNDSTLTDSEISSYLRAHPQFFEHHGDLLTEMYLPSQHGGGTVSLAERQQLMQRDRIRVMEAKMADMLKYGEENDTTTEKIHRLSLGLLASHQFDVLTQVLTHTLREDFKVPYVGLRIWTTPRNTEDASHEAFAEVDTELRDWTNSLAAPYCGHRPGLDPAAWFGADAVPKSFALAALRGEQTFGLLAMASDDEQRFYPDMGTMYLKRIGELVSASLLRYID